MGGSMGMYVGNAILAAAEAALRDAAAFVAGSMMSTVCVLSIGLYLAEVGLSTDQGWIVDGSKMVTLVLPFDVAAAVITIGLTVIASRSSCETIMPCGVICGCTE